ncbi:3-dehydroquinate synthase [Lachnospiraceae bacterium XBB1006]|nr:3-dehydroquinate synthase [Lachnospiraceae bacterium XBB1006]
MATVTVNGSRPYDVVIEQGALKTCGHIFRKKGICGKLTVITEKNVATFYLETLVKALKEADYEVTSIVLKAGEETKNINTIEQILSFLAKNKMDRGDTLVALGGGVIGDLTGFAAGVYLRGISYVQIPTTLLAAVDASVGGKTAIDLPEGKNLAGLFWHPALVLTDVACFRTLPQSVYRQGMAEVIKTAILAGEPLFSFCEELASGKEMQLEEVVTGCVAYKGRIVEEDFTEQGIRKLLNLGHTPAHSIEKRSGYGTSHGDAVAQGLYLMTAISCTRGIMSEEVGRRIFSLLDKENFPKKPLISPGELAEDAWFDKKRRGKTISLILPREIGDCRIEAYPLEALEELYEAGMRYLHERNH